MTERIFQSYCLQLCPAGLSTLTFTLLLQRATHGLDRAVPTSPSSGVTLELSKTDNSKIMPSFCLGKTVLSSSSNPINGSLTTVYVSKCRKKRGEKKRKRKKRFKEKKKRDFKVKTLCLIFFMNNAMAAVWHRAFCPHHGFSIIRILKVYFHLSPTFIGRYLTIQ